jgi:hypothetical protein
MAETLDLTRITLSPDRIAELALDDDKLLHQLLLGISPETKKAALREQSSKAILVMAENWPETLLPHWAYFIDLLRCDNGFSKYVAIYAVADLTRVAKPGLFEKAFSVYFGLLDDKSVMVASHAARNAGKLVRIRPELEDKITRRLLAIGKTHFEGSQQDLVKSYIIEALDGYMELAQGKAKILAFVRQQTACASPKTRKMAKAFLQKWEGDGGERPSA